MARTELSYCADQVRRFDNDRFVCLLFAPPAEREALSALYAFNLEIARIRETAREPLLGQMRLTWWRDAIDQTFAGTPPRHQVTMALAPVIARYGLSRDLFSRLLDGRARDLEDAAPPSLEALVDYAGATSASLQLLALRVLGCREAEVRDAASAVGIAWALVGLIRAVPFHARARRIYLPADLNRAAGLDVFQLYQKGAVAGVPQVVAPVAAAAREHVARARRLSPRPPVAALPALMPARLAEGYLDRLERAGFDPFTAPLTRRNGWSLLGLAWARVGRRF